MVQGDPHTTFLLRIQRDINQTKLGAMMMIKMRITRAPCSFQTLFSSIFSLPLEPLNPRDLKLIPVKRSERTEKEEVPIVQIPSNNDVDYDRKMLEFNTIEDIFSLDSQGTNYDHDTKDDDNQLSNSHDVYPKDKSIEKKRINNIMKL